MRSVVDVPHHAGESALPAGPTAAGGRGEAEEGPGAAVTVVIPPP